MKNYFSMNSSKISAVILCLIAIGGLQVAATNLMRLPITATLSPVSQTTYTIKLIKINLNEYFGSGTIVPANYLTQEGPLSDSGVITTTHIFQDTQVQEFLRNNSINLSGKNTMRCNYSFGESTEYAIFIPAKAVNQMTSNGWIDLEVINEIKTNGQFEANRHNPEMITQIFGSASQALDLNKSGVQKGDSGSMIFQKRASGINPIGVQFGYAKNSNSPLTIMWRLKKENNEIKSNIAWLRNKDNRVIWENGEYLPKNCGKI
jgi:hypothetical protein